MVGISKSQSLSDLRSSGSSACLWPVLVLTEAVPPPVKHKLLSQPDTGCTDFRSGLRVWIHVFVASPWDTGGLFCTGLEYPYTAACRCFVLPFPSFPPHGYQAQPQHPIWCRYCQKCYLNKSARIVNVHQINLGSVQTYLYRICSLLSP